MSQVTQLGESQLTHSPHDTITIQLVEPADLPAFVQVTWPLQPTILDPKTFGDSASVIVRMFSAAHVNWLASSPGGTSDRQPVSDGCARLLLGPGRKPAGPVGGCRMSRQGRNLRNPNRLVLPRAGART
jgi:hypothetical protein